MDLRLKELYINLKNYDFDLFPTYKIDKTAANQIKAAIEEMMSKEKCSMPDKNKTSPANCVR